MPAVIAAILAALKAIPVIADLVKWIGDKIDAYSKAKQEQEALKRKDEKIAQADAAIDAAVNGVRNDAPVQQRTPPDKPA